VEPSLSCLGIRENHILVKSRDQVWGVPMTLASWDLGLTAYRFNPRILKANSPKQLMSQIHGLVDPSRKPRSHEEPELKVRGHEGYDIYYYDSRYFASPQHEGSFDIEVFRSQPTSATIVGHTIKDVEEEIQRRSQQTESNRTRVLFLHHTPTLEVRKYLADFQNQDVTILPCDGAGPAAGYGAYKVAPFVADVRNPTSELVSYLRQQKYDVVVVPHEERRFWDGIHLEQFTAGFATCIVNVFPNGRARLYRGEDVHRIQYNKAYLNSMFRYIPSIKGKRVLEVGCSDGLACDLLLCEEPDQITGIDVMGIVGCAFKDPRLRYQRVDGSILPFPDASFDVSYSIATMEHVFDPFQVISEMKRVTRPGGYCYIQAGPLYFSPFGHHMFGYFDEEPWVHLRRSPTQMISRLKETGLADKIQRDLGRTAEDYVHSMINIEHINGRLINEYGLEHFEKRTDIEVLASTRSFEGENLLTDAICRELACISRSDLIAHGFELIFKIRS
jgi:SAM-dependent methyltransferase